MTDAHGNPTSASAEAVARYDAAIDRLVRYHPDVVALTMSLASDEPEFAMGQALAAYLSLMSTDPRDLPAVRDLAARVRRVANLDREQAHAGAVEAWFAGDWHGAAAMLDALLVRWPADVLALLMGHQLDFFVGNAPNLRDRLGHAIDHAHPHFGFVRGMQAFGLEESGHYAQSERAGLEAVDRNPDDVWAIHAVVHTYEMQGRVDDGIRFLRTREADWGSGNLFNVHNWWHFALYLLEAGIPAEALHIYDQHVHNASSDCVPLEMLDASALLWRLFIEDIDTGGRFAALADAWASSTRGEEPWYVFNDLHAVFAYCGAGRLARLSTGSPTTSTARRPVHAPRARIAA